MAEWSCGVLILNRSAVPPVVEARLEGEHVLLAEIPCFRVQTESPQTNVGTAGHLARTILGQRGMHFQPKTPLTTCASVTRASVSDSGLLW